MRRLFWIVVIAAALYGGYWFVGAQALERGAITWLEDEAARPGGLEPTYDSIAVRGFPSRFDLTITAPDIQDVPTGITWRAPFFQLFALSYRPTEVIAVFPDRQTLTIGDMTIPIRSTDLRASAAVAADADLPLDRATAQLEQLALGLPVGEVHADGGLFAIRRVPDQPGRYDVFGELTEIEIPVGALLPPGFDLSRTITALRIDGTADLTAPLDRFAAETRPELTALDVAQAQISWDGIELTARGTLTLGADGLPSGEGTLEARNWVRVIELATQAGLLTPLQATVLQGGLVGLSTGGLDQPLEIPFALDRGDLSVGGVDLGPLPMVR
ncbi:DUF2125 domain-containing protein [Aestuariibius sp. 2305UL40-4]|uniref:DUF2125 domain-containing protein n=1 Tax=Aestuariibius violaceus TaxID=3234132 RepID=UPI00345E4D02